MRGTEEGLFDFCFYTSNPFCTSTHEVTWSQGRSVSGWRLVVHGAFNFLTLAMDLQPDGGATREVQQQ